jgi:predicted esterase
MSDTRVQTDLSMKAEIDLYYDLYVPENLNQQAPLLLSIHGYGAHKRYMMKEARRIAPDDFVIASLQGPHQHFRKTDDGYRIGFGWLTDHRPDESVAVHHRFIFDVIAKLDAEELIDTSQIFLFGFSQACALNFRFAFTYPDVLRAVIGVCGGIPGDLDSNPAYKAFDADTFYLYGDDDEFYTLEKFREFDARLGKLLPNYHSKKYAAKHEITDEMRKDIRRFIVEISES